MSGTRLKSEQEQSQEGFRRVRESRRSELSRTCSSDCREWHIRTQVKYTEKISFLLLTVTSNDQSIASRQPALTFALALLRTRSGTRPCRVQALMSTAIALDTTHVS